MANSGKRFASGAWALIVIDGRLQCQLETFSSHQVILAVMGKGLLSSSHTFLSRQSEKITPNSIKTEAYCGIKSAQQITSGEWWRSASAHLLLLLMFIINHYTLYCVLQRVVTIMVMTRKRPFLRSGNNKMEGRSKQEPYAIKTVRSVPGCWCCWQKACKQTIHACGLSSRTRHSGSADDLTTSSGRPKMITKN